MFRFDSMSFVIMSVVSFCVSFCVVFGVFLPSVVSRSDFCYVSFCISFLRYFCVALCGFSLVFS